MRTTILYEDEHVIAAYKPAGFATQTARVGQADMVSELKNYLKNPYVGIVHRLDQPVEGVLVFGKTKAAAADLSAQLSRGVLNKRYLAVCCGKPAGQEGDLVNYLYKTADGRAEIVTREKVGIAADVQGENNFGGNAAKKAVLRYKILAEHCFSGERDFETEEKDRDVTICLADIAIETGRFHQIRAQMAHAGIPLLGDTKYGTEFSRQTSIALQVRNVALCACELEFMHPVTHRKMNFRVKPKENIYNIFMDKLPI